MKIKVPFYKQTTQFNCGHVALRMAISYLDTDIGLDIIEKIIGIKPDKGISTIQIAIAASALGYKTEFYSKNLLFNEENLKFDYYKEKLDINLEKTKKWIFKAKNVGVKVEEKIFSLEDILNFVTKDSLPIILINWDIIEGRKKYHGYFVPIVGYDEENIYIHNQGYTNTKPFMAIKRGLFDKARKSEGTDEDIVVIFKEKIQFIVTLKGAN